MTPVAWHMQVELSESDSAVAQDEKPLRVGVVGVGARAALAKHAKSLPAVTVVAAADPSPAATERVENRLGESVPLFPTVKELIDYGIDACIVTSPDGTHADVACELLEAGVAVFLEKPIAITAEDADRILKTALHTGSKLYVGHNMRHMDVVRRMRSLIEAGEIGEVKTIWCRHFVGHGGDFYFKDWHAERANTTGLLLQKGAHDIDVIHWLAGSRTSKVVAMGDLMIYGQIEDRSDNSSLLMGDWFSEDNWPPLEQRNLNPLIDVEDVSMVLMQLESGVLASYQQCHFTPDYWRNYTVIGTEGRMENFGDGEGGEIRVWKRRSGYRKDADAVYVLTGDEAGHGDADEATVKEFISFVRDGKPTATSPVAARDAVAAGEAATRSLREGNFPVDVPPAEPAVEAYFIAGQGKLSEEFPI